MYIKDPSIKDFITFLQITCIFSVCTLNEKNGKALRADQP